MYIHVDVYQYQLLNLNNEIFTRRTILEENNFSTQRVEIFMKSYKLHKESIQATLSR